MFMMFTINNTVPNAVTVNGQNCTEIKCNGVTVWRATIELVEYIGSISYNEYGDVSGPYFSYSGNLIPGNTIRATLTVPTVVNQFRDNDYGKIAHWHVFITVDDETALEEADVTNGTYNINITPHRSIYVYGLFEGWR